jgi:hypothetical protein
MLASPPISTINLFAIVGLPYKARLKTTALLADFGRQHQRTNKRFQTFVHRCLVEQYQLWQQRSKKEQPFTYLFNQSSSTYQLFSTSGRYP